ncbi:MAG: SDR family oxidoreductase [Candidatus Rokubacteria bacterium]|nr:SDR family oxidoreductase [Candidatus Rokubacteria bacterium]
MRVLVTGGAGFIGSHIVDACLEAGHQVVIVDDLSSGARANLNVRARWYRVDLRTNDIDAVVQAERPDVISHQAAQVSVRRSVEDPVLDASINVVGTLKLLEAARRHGVARVVFASTGGAIYGEIDAGAADERHPCRPLSPYAIAKLSVEHYLDGYRATHGLRSVVLRYANVYGPRQDPHGEAGVVAIFMQKILAGVTPTIFGDGGQTRDFVFVDDVVRANLIALTMHLDPATPTVFNVASGREVSVNDLWQSLATITGTRLSPVNAAPRPGDLRRSVLDPSRAKRELAWAPDVDLAQGLRRTAEWFTAAARERIAA